MWEKGLWQRDNPRWRRRLASRWLRFPKGGFETYIYGTPWSEDFMRQRSAAMDGVKAPPRNIGAEWTIAETVDALIVSYYKLVFTT